MNTGVLAGGMLSWKCRVRTTPTNALIAVQHLTTSLFLSKRPEPSLYLLRNSPSCTGTFFRRSLKKISGVYTASAAALVYRFCSL